MDMERFETYIHRAYSLRRNTILCLTSLALVGLLVASTSWQLQHGHARVASYETGGTLFMFSDQEVHLPNILTQKDSKLYQDIFRAQKKADWATADNAIAQLDN